MSEVIQISDAQPGDLLQIGSGTYLVVQGREYSRYSTAVVDLGSFHLSYIPGRTEEYTRIAQLCSLEQFKQHILDTARG